MADPRRQLGGRLQDQNTKMEKTQQVVVRENKITGKYMVMKFGTKVVECNTLVEAQEYAKQYEVALRTGVGLVSSNRVSR